MSSAQIAALEAACKDARIELHVGTNGQRWHGVARELLKAARLIDSGKMRRAAAILDKHRDALGLEYIVANARELHVVGHAGRYVRVPVLDEAAA